MANLTATALNTLNSAGVDFERAYAKRMRSSYERQLMMASINTPLVIAKIPPPGRGFFSVEEMYAVPELAQTPKPLPPRANRKLLLCQP